MSATISKCLAAVTMTLCLLGVQGCSDDEEPTPEPTPSASGSPFSATLAGPDVAAPGDQVVATLTNTGRLPDRYRLVASPVEGATITPVELGLAPDESAEVTIDVTASPVVIQVESIGAGGPGNALAELSIGAQE